MNDVIARMWDFKDYVLNRNVIKDDLLEQGEYEKALMQINELEEQIEKEAKERELITISRDRYLETCKRRSAEKKECRKELKDANEKIRMLEQENEMLKKQIEVFKNGTGSV